MRAPSLRPCASGLNRLGGTRTIDRCGTTDALHLDGAKCGAHVHHRGGNLVALTGMETQLEELMMVERSVELTDNRLGDAGAANQNNRLQRVRACAQLAAKLGR